MDLGIGITRILPLVIYLAGFIVVLLTITYRIEVGIYLLVILLPLQNLLDAMIQYPGGKDFLDILCLALVIKTFMKQDFRTIHSKEAGIVNVVVICIVIWTHFELWRGSLYLGSPLPVDFGDVRFAAWKNFAMLPLIYFIVHKNIKEVNQIKIILILMSISMLLMDRNFYHNFSDKNRAHYDHGLRISGTFVYLGPNELAVFYAQNTIIVVSLLFFDENIRRRLLFLITTLFNYFCLVFLYSRGGYIATLTSWLFFGLAKDKKILMILLFFVTFWRTIVPPSVEERIDMSVTGEGEFDHSWQSREVMWKEAIGIFSSNPIIGVGFKTVPFLNVYVDRKRNSLHNGYLETVVEQGTIGLGLYLWLYIISIRYGWRLYRNSIDPFMKGFGLGFVGCVFAIIAGNIGGSYWFYINVSGFYWINLALVTRGINLGNKNMIGREPRPFHRLARVNIE